MSKRKPPRVRLERYLQVPPNFRELVIEKNLSQAEILTFLLACEETVGKGRKAARLSNTYIAGKNSISESTAIRARTSLKQHGMLSVEVSEDCWQTHEPGLVSLNFPIVQTGDVDEEADPEMGATVTHASSSTVTGDRGATVTDDRENHLDEPLLEENQEELLRADSQPTNRKRGDSPAVSVPHAGKPQKPNAKARSPAKATIAERAYSEKEDPEAAPPLKAHLSSGNSRQRVYGEKMPPGRGPFSAEDFSAVRGALWDVRQSEPPEHIVADCLYAGNGWSGCEIADFLRRRFGCFTSGGEWKLKPKFAPSGRNYPRGWNYYIEAIRNEAKPGHLPEQPATPRPEHHVEPEVMDRALETIDSIVESVLCPRCGDSVIRYIDGTFRSCKCGGRATKPKWMQPGSFRNAAVIQGLRPGRAGRKQAIPAVGPTE